MIIRKAVSNAFDLTWRIVFLSPSTQRVIKSKFFTCALLKKSIASPIKKGILPNNISTKQLQITANVSGIDLTLNKVTYINGKPKIDETRSPTDGTKPKSASKEIFIC